MIINDIKDLLDKGELPDLSKSQVEYFSVVFSFEYLKATGFIDNLRSNGVSEAFINGYIEGVYSALQTIYLIDNKDSE